MYHAFLLLERLIWRGDSGGLTNNINGQDNNNGTSLSVHGLTATGDAATGQAVDDDSEPGPSTTANEFNITNYLIPTPETDWLFRPG